MDIRAKWAFRRRDSRLFQRLAAATRGAMVSSDWVRGVMKLPVFKAVRATFAFAARNWLELARIAWAPAILTFAAEYLTQPIRRGYLAELASLTVQDTASVLYVIWQNLPALLVSMIAITLPWIILVTGVFRLVIRDERPKQPFYVGLGMDEVRMFLTILLLTAVDFVFQICLVLTSLAATYASQTIPRVGALAPYVFGAITVFVACRFYLRLSLTLPATIATRRVGVIPSIRATRMNEMHLLGFWLVWTLIALVVFAAFGTIVLSSMAVSYHPTFNPADASVGGQYDDFGSASRFGLDPVVTFFLDALVRFVNVAAAILTAIAGGIAWRMIHENPAPEVEPATGIDLADQPT